MTTSNLTGDIAMSCPTVAYSGRLMPIKIEGAIPAIVNSTLGGWPDEPGNRAFDPEVDGGPALIGGVERDGSMFIHWRAPTVSDSTESRFFLTHPDGTALAECTVSIQTGEPPARRPIPELDDSIEHDGTGGPFPFREPEPGIPLSVKDTDIQGPMPNGDHGDGSQGPMVPGSDGSGGQPLPTQTGMDPRDLIKTRAELETLRSHPPSGGRRRSRCGRRTLARRSACPPADRPVSNRPALRPPAGGPPRSPAAR